jgi:hypothetical protein
VIGSWTGYSEAERETMVGPIIVEHSSITAETGSGLALDAITDEHRQAYISLAHTGGWTTAKTPHAWPKAVDHKMTVDEVRIPAGVWRVNLPERRAD